MAEKRVCSFFIGSKLFKERGTRTRHDAEDICNRPKLNDDRSNATEFNENKTVDSATPEQRITARVDGVETEQKEIKKNDFEEAEFDEKEYVDHLLATYKEIKVEIGEHVNACNEPTDFNGHTIESRKAGHKHEEDDNVSRRKRKRPTKHCKDVTLKKEMEGLFDINMTGHQESECKPKVISKRKRGRPSKLCKDASVKKEMEDLLGINMTESQNNEYKLKIIYGKTSKRKRRRPTKRCKDAAENKDTEDIDNAGGEQSEANVHDKPKPKKKERNILCNICGKCLSSIPSLRRHLTIHTKGTNLKCNVCGRKCIDERRYEIHMASHTGGKPYCCETCGGCFTSAGMLSARLNCTRISLLNISWNDLDFYPLTFNMWH